MGEISEKLKKIPLNPPLFLTLGFAILILAGAIILNFGFMNYTGDSIGFINALFTAGSASCVTGLVVVNTGEFWNFWGQLVIIILIQIGGLGIMTLATIFPIVMRKRIGLAERQIIKEQLNVETLRGMVKLLKYVIKFTFSVEFLGSLALSIRFIPVYGIEKGIWFSIFHAISAFCNAGFDLTLDSIVPFQTDPIVNFTIMLLIIIGGLGFMVNQEILSGKPLREYSVHAKIALSVSAILIFVGALIFLMIEYNNPYTMKDDFILIKILKSLFHSVVARTAGFYSVDMSLMRDSAAFLLIILMFVGGSPGSTAGGLKTTTFGVLFASMMSTIRGEESTVLYNKKISEKTIQKALALVFLSLIIVVGISFILTITESAHFLDILFETVSAYATVGLTRGITPNLTDVGKIILTLTMYAGRVGPLTLAFAITKKPRASKLKFPEANISIG